MGGVQRRIAMPKPSRSGKGHEAHLAFQGYALVDESDGNNSFIIVSRSPLGATGRWHCGEIFAWIGSVFPARFLSHL
jgi:hypothetical protein